MLTVSHLTKRYKKLLANDDLNFTVDPGEITVLAGPNGAGKSTAIKCIAGLLRYEGSIWMDPIQISRWKPSVYSGIYPKSRPPMIP